MLASRNISNHQRRSRSVPISTQASQEVTLTHDADEHPLTVDDGHRADAVSDERLGSRTRVSGETEITSRVMMSATTLGLPTDKETMPLRPLPDEGLRSGG